MCISTRCGSSRRQATTAGTRLAEPRRSHLFSDTLASPINAVISVFVFIRLGEQDLELLARRPGGCIILCVVLAHETLKAFEMAWISPHAVDEDEEVDVVRGHCGGLNGEYDTMRTEEKDGKAW